MKMRFKAIAIGLLLLVSMGAWAQDGAAPAANPGLAARMPTRSPARSVRTAATPEGAFEGRLQDMQNTLRQMHALLDDMQARMRTLKVAAASAGSAKSSGADEAPIMSDNLKMWQLLLDHLDSTMAQARMSAMRRSMTQRMMSNPPSAQPNPAPSAAPQP